MPPVDATSEIPDLDYVVPLDKAAVRRSGSEVTILSWLLMSHFSLDAAKQLAAEGVEAEVIDVRSLAPIDYLTIGHSVKKTGRVVIVEENWYWCGIGAQIALCAARAGTPCTLTLLGLGAFPASDP